MDFDFRGLIKSYFIIVIPERRWPLIFIFSATEISHAFLDAFLSSFGREDNLSTFA